MSEQITTYHTAIPTGWDEVLSVPAGTTVFCAGFCYQCGRHCLVTDKPVTRVYNGSPTIMVGTGAYDGPEPNAGVTI